MVQQKKGQKFNKQVSSTTQRDVVRKALLTLNKSVEKTNDGINIFNGEFKSEFADYVRFLNPDYKKLSDDEAVKILSDDIALNTSGTLLSILRDDMEQAGAVPESNKSVFKSAEKDYNFERAASVYSDACKFVMNNLAKKHHENSFYDLKDSEDEKACEEYKNFTEWKDKQDKDFIETNNTFDACKDLKSSKPLREKLFGEKVIDRGYYYETKKGPVKRLKSKMDDFRLSNTKGAALAFAGFTAFTGTGLIAVFYNALKNEQGDKILEEWGIDKETAIEIAQSNLKEYSPEDYANLKNLTLLESQNDIAVANGYTDYNQACADILNHSTIETQSKTDALNNLAIERTEVNDAFAKNQGFENYDEVLAYLEQHKTLSDETESRLISDADWSEYAYDTVDAKAMANQLSAIDEQYADLESQIQNGSFDLTVQKFDDERFEELANTFDANESYHNIVFDRFDSTNVFGTSTNAQELFLDVESAYNGRGVEILQIKEGSLSDTLDSGSAPTVSSEVANIDGSGFNIDLDDLALAIGGTAGAAAAIGATIKLAPYLTKLIKAKKVEKRQQVLDEMAKYDDLEMQK